MRKVYAGNKNSFEQSETRAFYSGGYLLEKGVGDSIKAVLPNLRVDEQVICICPHGLSDYAAEIVGKEYRCTYVELSEGALPAGALPANDESIGLIVLFNFYDRGRMETVIAEVNRCLANDQHFVIASLSADPFADCFGILRQAYFNGKFVVAPPVYSTDIEKAIRDSKFDVHSFEVGQSQYSRRLADWYNECGIGAIEQQERLKHLIENAARVAGEDGPLNLRGDQFSLSAAWTICMSTKGDKRRHLVPAVAAAILVRTIDGERHILLQRRRREAQFWNQWELPQGHLRGTETFLEAAHRELFEEAGLTGNVSRSQPFWGLSTRGGAALSLATHLEIPGTARKEFICIPVAMEYIGGEPCSSEQDREFMWTNKRRIADLLDAGDIFPLNEPILRECVDTL